MSKLKPIKMPCSCADASCNAEIHITRAIGMAWVKTDADGQHVDLFLSRDQGVAMYHWFRDWLTDPEVLDEDLTNNREEVVINS